jgi:membrane protein YqaA with SNARE-associated domain
VLGSDLLNALCIYVSLFLVAMLAATILPGSSEAMLVALVARESASTTHLLIAAAVCNTLGAVVNWCLGRWLFRYSQAPWFPANPRRLAKASRL